MSELLSTLAEIALTMSAVILLLLALGPLLSRRYGSRWRYWAWLAVAVRLLVPVNVPLPQAPVALEAPPDRVVYTAPSREAVPSPAPAPSGAVPGGQGEVPGTSGTAETPPARVLTLSQVLFWGWLSGAAGVLLWHWVGWLRFQSYLRRWAAPAEAPPFLPALAEELGIAAPVRLLTCPGLKGPMMTGICRPTILLPREGPGPEDLWFVLRHELTHFQRRDIAYKALLLCAGALYWFDPLVWAMLHAAEGDLERCCDQDVVRGLPPEDRERYGQIILDTARGGKAPGQKGASPS